MNQYLVFITLVGLTTTHLYGQSPSSSFKAITSKPADKVEFVSKGEKLLVNVSSVDGIGTAIIKRNGGNWPRKLIICFNLKQLEHIQMTNGITIVEGRFGGDEWEVTPHQNDVLKANIRKNGEFIEAEVPAVLLPDASKEIVVKWIDAYR
jgi:hypothetical protein